MTLISYKLLDDIMLRSHRKRLACENSVHKNFIREICKMRN